MNLLKAGGPLGIILAVIIFSIIVIIHEFGHYLLAKQHGITVTEFSIGMGPKLFSFKKGGTVWAVKLLPIGGSCMMLGEDGLEDSEGSFTSKSVWARMSVVLAGPVFNFVLAFIFAIVILAFTGYRSGQISDVEAGSPAQEAGLMAGDEIIKIDDKKIQIFSELSVYMSFHPGQIYNVIYIRDGEKHSASIKPFWDDAEGRYRIGIMSMAPQKANFVQLLKYGFYEVKYNVWAVVESLKMMVTGNVSRDDISGPVGIVTIVDDSYHESKEYGGLSVFLTMSNLIVILSANLGVMNLLPIPALDGGRMLFLIIEAIKGKPLNREREGIVNLIGFALLMVLMVFVLFNDVSKLFR